MSEISIKNQGLTSMLERQLLGIQAKNAEQTEKKSLGATLSASQDAGSFMDTLKNAIQNTNELQLKSDDTAKNFAAGKGSLHEMLISMEKADVALRTITSVRSKLIEAYQEIIKMPV